MDTRMATCPTRTTRLLVLVLALLLTGHLAANPDGHHETARLPLAAPQFEQATRSTPPTREAAVASLAADTVAASHGGKDAHPRWCTAGQCERGIAPRQRLAGEVLTASGAVAGCHLGAAAASAALEHGSGVCSSLTRWRARTMAARPLTPSSLQIFRL